MEVIRLCVVLDFSPAGTRTKAMSFFINQTNSTYDMIRKVQLYGPLFLYQTSATTPKDVTGSVY